MTTLSRAVFLDRDGTIIEDRHFIKDPSDVRLLDGAASAIGRLRAAGYRVVVVTNQSGIARGLIDWPQYRAVAHQLDALLATAGVALDGTYLCPHHPGFTGPCLCRKPGLELYQNAARDLSLDLAQSIWIGDQLRDVEPASAFGALGLLIDHGVEPTREAGLRAGFQVVASLAAATDLLGLY